MDPPKGSRSGVGCAEKPEREYGIVDAIRLGANARYCSCDPGGGGYRIRLRLTIYQTLLRKWPCSRCAHACARLVSFYVMGSLVVSASYLSFLVFVFVLFSFLCSRWSFLCRCFSALFWSNPADHVVPDWQPNRIYY